MKVDFSNDDGSHLVPVLTGEYKPRTLLQHTDDVGLFRHDCEEANVWTVVVDGESRVTFNAKQVKTTMHLALFLDRYAADLEDDDPGDEPDQEEINVRESAAFQ